MLCLDVNYQLQDEILLARLLFFFFKFGLTVQGKSECLPRVWHGMYGSLVMYSVHGIRTEYVTYLQYSVTPS